MPDFFFCIYFSFSASEHIRARASQCGPAKAAQRPAVDRRSTSVLCSISSRCVAARVDMCLAAITEVAEAVTAINRLAPMSLHR